MNKTATILSRDEIALLPQAERPLNHRLPSKIYHDVFEAVGAASMCWTKPRGSGMPCFLPLITLIVTTESGARGNQTPAA